MEQLLIFLLMLQLKHFYLDFVAQTETELKYKGVYSNFSGMTHSIKHGFYSFICTLLILELELYYILLALLVGIIDFVVHYHVDFIKSKYGPTDISNKNFWVWFGFDQLIHQLTYLLLITIVF